VLGTPTWRGRFLHTPTALVVSEARHEWHACPAAWAIIPRTLLQLPTWVVCHGAMTSMSICSSAERMTIHKFMGMDVEMVQKTKLSVGRQGRDHRESRRGPKRFTLRVRAAPIIRLGTLYTTRLSLRGSARLAVDGQTVPVADGGRLRPDRAGLAGGGQGGIRGAAAVQRVKAEHPGGGGSGRVALRYGPLIYNRGGGGRQRPECRAGIRFAADHAVEARSFGGGGGHQGKVRGGRRSGAIPKLRAEQPPACRARAGGGAGVWSQVWINER